MTLVSGQDAANTLPESDSHSATSPNYWRAAAAIIVVLSGLVYLPSIRGTKIWDDAELLSGRGISGSATLLHCFTSPFLNHYYRPLTSASFLIDHRIWDHGAWGSNTFGYHLTNLLFHVLTTAILIPMLLTAFRSKSIALAGALLFAMQPAQISTVAWIGGRTDSLCTLIISLFCLAIVSGATATGVKRNGWLTASLICFAAAAAAKEQALFLLPMAPLGLYLFRTHRRTELDPNAESVLFPAHQRAESARAIRAEMALWMVGYAIVAFGMLAAWRRFGNPVPLHWNLGVQLRLVGQTIDYYTLLLITPTPKLIHSLTLGSIQRLGPVGVVLGYMIGGVALGVFVKWLRSTPEAAWFLAGALLLLAPVSNLFPLVTQTVAPYRIGTAGLFVAGVLGWAVIRLLESCNTVSRKQMLLAAAPACLYGVWLLCLTTWGSSAWKDALTASSTFEMYDPDSNYAALETASAYLDLGKVEPALIRLDKIASELPKVGVNTPHLDNQLLWTSRDYLTDWIGELYGTAGTIQLDKGDRPGAIVSLNRGGALSPRNVVVNTGLANYALSVNDFVGGEKAIRSVLAQQPNLTNQRLVLGQILMRENRWAEAEIELDRCRRELPNTPQLYLLLAQARINAGDRLGASAALSEGVKRKVLEADKLKAWLKSIGEPGLTF